MVFKLRKTPISPLQPIPPRWFAGLSLSNDASRIDAALVGVHGQGSGAPIEIRKTISFDLPGEIVSLYDEVLEAVAGEDFGETSVATYRDGFPRPLAMEKRYRLTREMSQIVEEAFHELSADSQLPATEIMAVGINDPGIRNFTSLGQRFESLCDPDYFARNTGMNTIDAFPVRDIAAGGQGGPVFSFPTWVLLKSDGKDRILLDLGKAAKLTWIPKTSRLTAAREIDYQDIVPCGLLLDALTYQLTKGETSIDQGGRLTVQGRHLPELLEQWRELAVNEPVWSPYGPSPAPYLQLTLGHAESAWSVRDILCSASYLIVDEVVDAVLEYIGKARRNTADVEILLCGGARQHGFLLNRLSTRLTDNPITPISRVGIPEEAFDALCTAVLAMMFVDQIPSNLPHLTGSETSVPLGRLTPGNPVAWQRLLQSMASAKPVQRTLRSAM